MKKISSRGISILELLTVGLVAIIVIALTFAHYAPHRVSKMTLTQAVFDLKTLDSTVKSYYIFSNPHTYPPSTSTLGASYLVKALPKKLPAPLYDVLASSKKTEYIYKRSSNGDYYVIFSQGLNKDTSAAIDINNNGHVRGLDADGICITNGSGCTAYSCCEGQCGPEETMHCYDCHNQCSKNQTCVEDLCCPANKNYDMNCYGSCVDSHTDNNNCGGCENVCPANTQCFNGHCQCSPGNSQCNGECINTTKDNENCGACGNVCPSNSICIKSDCHCKDKDSSICPFSGCVNIKTDNNNCGRCGNVCPSSSKCFGGACLCNNSELSACSSQGCVDTQTDSLNCGQCGNTCNNSNFICSQGSCSCPYTLCGANCTNVESDSNNCGQCGVICPTNTNCKNSKCTS